MKRRQLLASINNAPIGVLQAENGIWEFTYARTWLEHPQRFPLSPFLPLSEETLRDGAIHRPVQWYFDNLLPEEGQRTLLAKDAHIDAADAFALLEYYGAESAGSLTLLPPGAVNDAGSLHALSDEMLHERIRRLPKAPLTHNAPKRMSLAGAQHKLAVVLDDGQLFEPSGAAASTHILKPNHPDEDYPHSVVNEWFVMRLARQVGLSTPNVERRYVPAPIYLVERFDRLQEAGHWRRRHAIDACQLLGVDRAFKYAQGSVRSLAFLANACRSPAVARTRLFAWLVFNVIIGNSDAHLKNLSFLVSHEGIQLAPFYDLLGIGAYDMPAFNKSGWPDTTRLAWPILGNNHFSDMTRPLLVEAGAELKLAKPTAARLLDKLRDDLPQAAESLYATVEVENQTLLASRPELAPTLAGELRCLRAICHGVIKEMVNRLR